MVYPVSTFGAFDDENLFGHYEPQDVFEAREMLARTGTPLGMPYPTPVSNAFSSRDTSPHSRPHSRQADAHSNPHEVDESADDDTIIDSVKDIASFHKRHLKERYPGMAPERRENIWRLVTLHRSAKYRREKYRQDPEWRGKLINNAKEFRARKERSHSRKSLSQEPDSSSSETSPSRQPRTPEASFAQQAVTAFDSSYIHAQLAAVQDQSETKPLLYDLPDQSYFYNNPIPSAAAGYALPPTAFPAYYSSLPRTEAKVMSQPYLSYYPALQSTRQQQGWAYPQN